MTQSDAQLFALHVTADGEVRDADGNVLNTETQNEENDR